MQAKIYKNGHQTTISAKVMEEYNIKIGDYITVKLHNKRMNDYAIFTVKVSERGIITFPSWAVRSLWLKPGDSVEIEIVKVHKVGGVKGGDTQPRQNNRHREDRTVTGTP